MSDIYVNPRAAGVRIVQYVTLGATVVVALIGISDGLPAFALIAGVIGLACTAALEFLFVRNYVTRVGDDGAGWVMHTLTTFGERPVRFEASHARLGGEVRRYTLYGQTNVYYPFYITGRRYFLDATPPVQFDVAAFQRHFPT